MTTISLAGALFILLLAPVAIITMMLLTNADLFDRIPLKDENQAYYVLNTTTTFPLEKQSERVSQAFLRELDRNACRCNASSLLLRLCLCVAAKSTVP